MTNLPWCSRSVWFGISSVFKLAIAACLLGSAWAQMPDTTINRYATAADAAWWPTVNQGDYIYFKGNNDSNQSIYSSPTVNPISLPVGKKILIWQGSYKRIFFDGTNCASTSTQPTIITNLGGQVKWGFSTSTTSQYRSFEITNFAYVFLTGKYDLAAKTGDANFLGHNGGANMGSGDYYEKYGFWGNQLWSGERYMNISPNTVRISGFLTCKVSYVAAWGGGFAGFNIKSDSPAVPKRVEVDVQDCFSGFQTGEGFYISYSTNAVGQDLTKLTLRNNILAFTGAEALQTDNLTEGSVIENNIVIGSGCFYRTPFQGLHNQEGMHQPSFVEGDITVRKNLLVGGSTMVQGVRFKDPGLDGSGNPRAFPLASKTVKLEDNFVGFTRSHISYFWQGDGITPYILQNNVYGPMSNPLSSDAYVYNPIDEPPAAFDIANTNSPITLSNNRFSHDRDAYSYSGTNITQSGSYYAEPPVIKFKNLGFADGFDVRRVAFWATQYEQTDKAGQYIPYKVGDIVYYYDSNGVTKFFQCLADHVSTATTTYDPNTATAQWQALTWGGRGMPPLDVRLAANTYYNYRGMGLSYNEANTTATDLTAPTITLFGVNDMNIPQGQAFVDPGWQATDNKDGNLSSQVVAGWSGPAINVSVPGEYYRTYRVVDAAGNASEPLTRTVTVSSAGITLSKKAQINMHLNGAINLAGWTDIGNNATGLVNNSGTTVGITNTNVFDTTGVDTNWDLMIEDNPNAGGVSEHFGIHTNSAGVAIGEFPAAVTKQGLKIRDPFEDPCLFVLTGLNPAKYYDVRYTGYIQASSTIPDCEAELSEAISGRKAVITVKNNTNQVGQLRSLKPNASGQLSLRFSTETPGGQPNLSGLILQEKSGFGWNAYSALFEQNFQASTSVSDYWNAASPMGCQFNDISKDVNGGTWSINGSGQLQLVRSGGASPDNGAGFTRYTNFAATPTVLKVKFDLGASGTSSQNDLMILDIGAISGWTDYNSGTPSASTFGRLNIDGSGTNIKFEMNGTQSAAYAANGTMYAVTYYLNKSGTTQNYTGPDGSAKTIGANNVSLWVGTVCLFDNVVALNGASSALTDLRVRFQFADSHTWKFDNFVITNAF